MSTTADGMNHIWKVATTPLFMRYQSMTPKIVKWDKTAFIPQSVTVQIVNSHTYFSLGLAEIIELKHRQLQTLKYVTLLLFPNLLLVLLLVLPLMMVEFITKPP